MRINVSIYVTKLDHTHVEKYEDDDGDEMMTVALSDDVSVFGEAKVVKEWVEELHARVSIA